MVIFIETLKKDFQQNMNRYDFTHEAMHPLKSVSIINLFRGIWTDKEPLEDVQDGTEWPTDLNRQTLKLQLILNKRNPDGNKL